MALQCRSDRGSNKKQKFERIGDDASAHLCVNLRSSKIEMPNSKPTRNTYCEYSPSKSQAPFTASRATRRVVIHQGLNKDEALKPNKQNKMAFYELIFNEFNFAKEIARYAVDSYAQDNRQ